MDFFVIFRIVRGRMRAESGGSYSEGEPDTGVAVVGSDAGGEGECGGGGAEGGPDIVCLAERER